MYEFGELDLSVVILINSKHIPEDVVELSLGGLIEDLDGEFSELIIIEISLFLFIVFVKVDLQLIPDGVNEGELLFRYTCRVCIFLFYRGPRINIVSKVFSDEVNELLESDESILISVKFSEDELEIFSSGFELDEITSFKDESDKLFKGDLFGGPNFAVGWLVSSVEKNFNEVDREDDGNELFESAVIIILLQKSEVSIDYVWNFIFVKFEDLLQDGSDLFNFENQIFVGIISEENISQLVNNDSDESIESIKIFVFQQKLFVFWQDRLSRFLNFEWFSQNGGKGSEVISQEEEINLVGDPSVFVKIDLREKNIDDILRSFKLDVLKGNVESFSKFYLTHDSLRTFLIELLSVESLNSHLTEMLLDTEVSQFIISDAFVVIAIVSENVSSDVLEF